MKEVIKLETEEDKYESRQIYRLRTEHYGDSDKFYFKKSFYKMKTLSKGHSPFSEEISNMGISEALDIITNLDLDNMEDGLYELVCHSSRDYYGEVDDVHYTLVEI